MTTILLILATLAIIFQIVSLVEVSKSIQFYYNSPVTGNTVKNEHNPYIVIIIPVLREQRVIKDTISYFQRFITDKVKLVIVTTGREDAERVSTEQSTREVLEQLHTKFIFHALHYPEITGTKADQINYCLSKLSSIVAPENHYNTFISIYDADSRPSKTTFLDAVSLIRNTPQGNVFQQSATFFGNIKRIALTSSMDASILAAMAVHQTRFTLCYELPRYRRRLLRLFSRPNFLSFIFRGEYVHCVGHGLFVRASFLKRVPFPSGQVMEDIFYGVILSCLNEPIFPLSTLDQSDVPESLSAIFSQKVRWFSGVAKFPSNLRYIKNTYGNLICMKRLLLVGAYGLFDVVIWLLLGWWPFFLALVTFNWLSTPGVYTMNLFCGSLIVFGLYSASMGRVAMTINKCLKLTGAAPAALPYGFVVRVSLLTPVVLFIHSFAAWCSLAILIMGRSRAFLYSKTERI